jgi:hypothetical protein
VVSEHVGNFTGALRIKKFKELMVTIDKNDSAAEALQDAAFSVFEKPAWQRVASAYGTL